MNPDLKRLQAYPFEKLRALLADIEVPNHLPMISLAAGEPQDGMPPMVGEGLARYAGDWARYPATEGLAELRKAIADWLSLRYGTGRAIDPDRHILPVSGTREALFSIAQTVVDRSRPATILCPNPFYQIYEGAALLAGATLSFYSMTEPFWRTQQPAGTALVTSLESCQLMYVCSPDNPSGVTLDLDDWRRLLEYADRYNFVLASDECYAEIYRCDAAPPTGLLEACIALGRTDFSRCMVFHSLSKRSSAPGLRSGFVAGDSKCIEAFRHYRTYQGCTMPIPIQRVSALLWSDEAHVQNNRQRYQRRFDIFQEELGMMASLTIPTAGFYLWPKTPVSDTDFARALWQTQHVLTLPGQYLARSDGQRDGNNPGLGRCRWALVPTEAECREAARRIAQCWRAVTALQ